MGHATICIHVHGGDSFISNPDRSMNMLLSWKNIIYVIIPEIPTGISGIMNCHMFYRLCYWKTAFSESYMYDAITTNK